MECVQEIEHTTHVCDLLIKIKMPVRADIVVTCEAYSFVEKKC